MNEKLRQALRTDFVTFHAKAFATLVPGRELSGEYIGYLCQKMKEFADGDITRLLINMPPRHLKTFTASVCGSAWLLAHDPTLKILIVTGSDGLSKEIADHIRTLLNATWFKESFAARIRKDRSATRRFEMRQGGGVRVASVLGRFTGHGGDVVIVDDPHQINDARELGTIDRVIDSFDTQIRSRLNRQAGARMMVIGHRVHERDLSGHLLRSGEWSHVCLPLVAPKDVKVSSHWHRRTGDLLMPGSHSVKELEELFKSKTLPDFETLYQQDPSHGLRPITPHDFRSYGKRDFSSLPVVISIDPGHVPAASNSFNVVQVWARDHRHRLIYQYRAQAPYDEFRRECQRLVRKYRPSAVVIEMTGHGPALSSQLKLNRETHLEQVHPSLSKAERLAEHIETICGRKISLPRDAEWRGIYIAEFVNFPNTRFTDQIDATTQYLSFMARNPHLKKLPPNTLQAAVVLYSAPQEWHRLSAPQADSKPTIPAALALGSRFNRYP